MTDRIAVFIDYMNCYKGARDAFFSKDSPSPNGQVYPRRLGIKVRRRAAGDRVLETVRVYRGLPSSQRDPKGYGAADRQIALWKAQERVEVFTRPLNYRDPQDPKEKGIDVRLAVDMVRLAMKDEYDIAVLVSDDTDLLPALEAVLEIKGPGSCEVATWVPSDGRHATPLRLQNGGGLIHRLDRRDYGHCEDATDYTVRRRRR